MSNESRTTKSIKNAEVTLLFYFVQLLLGFFSRKAFFDYLGSEVLGLYTTASNLLGFLNLAELGIGMVVGYFMYQPLYDNDHNKINEIVSLQGWIYRRIAFLILTAAAILMAFFPMIFAKSPLPIYYAYITFGVLLFSSMLGYFANYKQVVLQADQKGYKLQKVVNGIAISKTIAQIIAVTYSSHPFAFWVALEFIGACLSAIVLQVVLRREYPWLKTHVGQGKHYLKKYPELLKKTGQAFFHRISGVVLDQCSPLIIYAFSSLSMVALYGNYLLIVSKCTLLISSVFGSTTAAIGNLVASNDTERALRVFYELFESRFCIITIMLSCLFNITDPFITLWLGEEYSLGTTFLTLYLLLQSVMTTRNAVDGYIYAFGLYKDIWAPVVEAVIQISSSIVLGHFYGLNGIIVGIMISQIAIPHLWKPFFLFHEGFKMSAIPYYTKLVLFYILGIGLTAGVYFIIKWITPFTVTSWTTFIGYSCIVVLISTIVISTAFLVVSQGTRDFAKRMTGLVRAKLHTD